MDASMRGRRFIFGDQTNYGMIALPAQAEPSTASRPFFPPRPPAAGLFQGKREPGSVKLRPPLPSQSLAPPNLEEQ